MKTTDSVESVELESKPARVVRLTFLGSLAFWPLFLFGASTMLPPVGKTAAAQIERHILIYCVWLFPVAVILGWLFSKWAMRRGKPDSVCLLPWLIPTAVFSYWILYLLL